MDIKNKYCLIIELTTEQLNNLTDLMPTSDFFDYFSTDTIIGFRCDGTAGTFGYDSEDQLISYTEMMQLLGKAMKEFTKSDLKTGMFVKQRNGNFKVVLGDAICGDNNNYGRLDEYKENLINICKNTAHDVMAAYNPEKGASLTSYLKGNNITLIWERIEQTPAQKEMEVLLTNMVTLEYETKSKMEEIQKQIKVVQAKL
jgi:hypothetical protein